MCTKIVIVGMGGVGGYYGGLLARRYENDPEIDIYFVARNKHLAAIQANGLTVVAENETFVCKPKLASDDVAEIGVANYVILATKSYDLAATIEQIKPCIDHKTIILPLLNGADIDERIAKLLPHNTVWKGCVYIVGRLIEPGVVKSSGGVHDLYFGYNNGVKQELNFLHKTMLEAGIKSNLCEDIDMKIWRKFIFISTTATLSSYFNCGFRDLLTNDERKNTTHACLREIIAVANALGVVFDFDIFELVIKHIERLPFGTTSSMNSDFVAGKQTELETLTKVVIDYADKLNIEVPSYKKLYEALLKKTSINTNLKD